MRKPNDFGGAAIWIVLVILGIGVWVGFAIGKLYFDRETIQNEIAVIGDDTLVGKRGDAKERIARTLDQYHATYEADKIVAEVNGAGDRISLTVPYRRLANLVVLQYPVDFQINIQREAHRAAGVINQIQDSLESSDNVAAQKYEKALQQ